MSSIKIAAVGDILMWPNQIRSAKTSDDSYSFDYMFKEVQPLLTAADLTIGNLETTFSGREKYYQRVNSEIGGPAFNCPDDLAETLKTAGFDVLTTANNHCLDRGINGLKRTLDILDKSGICHTGTFRCYEESKNKLILQVKDITIGILACTYGTNGYELSSQEAWAVNYIEKSVLPQIYELKMTTDLTIVCMHAGREFTSEVVNFQKYWAQLFFDYGADIILGAHPHVIQPMTFNRLKSIDAVEKDRFLAYSLGDFISDILWDDINTVTGVILNLEVTKNDLGETMITNVEYIPTWVLRNSIDDKTSFVILPISKYLNDSETIFSTDILDEMKEAWENTITLLGKNAR